LAWSERAGFNLSYLHGSPFMVMVDMPGYGFAFAAEERVEEWQGAVRYALRYCQESVVDIELTMGRSLRFLIICVSEVPPSRCAHHSQPNGPVLIRLLG
jgi:hypothetical protein